MNKVEYQLVISESDLKFLKQAAEYYETDLNEFIVNGAICNIPMEDYDCIIYGFDLNT